MLLLATAVYGAKALYPAFGFALLEIALYGAGLWNLMYLYVWPIAVLMALPIRQSRSRALWAAPCGAARPLFRRAVRHPVSFSSADGRWRLRGGFPGIPYDVIHCVSNAVLTFVLLPPLRGCSKRSKPARPEDKNAKKEGPLNLSGPSFDRVEKVV